MTALKSQLLEKLLVDYFAADWFPTNLVSDDPELINSTFIYSLNVGSELIKNANMNTDMARGLYE